MSVQITDWYQITVITDGIKSSDHYYQHAIEAVEAWQKFCDYGDAVETRVILFISPYDGEVRKKTFHARNRAKASK